MERTAIHVNCHCGHLTVADMEREYFKGGVEDCEGVAKWVGYKCFIGCLLPPLRTPTSFTLG